MRYESAEERAARNVEIKIETIEQKDFVDFMNRFFAKDTDYKTISTHISTEYISADATARIEFCRNNWGEKIIRFGRIQKGKDIFETAGSGRTHCEGGKDVTELLPALRPASEL